VELGIVEQRLLGKLSQDENPKIICEGEIMGNIYRFAQLPAVFLIVALAIGPAGILFPIGAVHAQPEQSVALITDGPKLTPVQGKFLWMAAASRSRPGYDASGLGEGTLDIFSAVNGAVTPGAYSGSIVRYPPDSVTLPTHGNISWKPILCRSLSWNGRR
jgi:hypothetical protein